jgi:hypothetical protein
MTVLGLSPCADLSDFLVQPVAIRASKIAIIILAVYLVFISIFSFSFLFSNVGAKQGFICFARL